MERRLAVNDYVFNVKIQRLEKNQENIREQLEQLLSLVKPEEDLWDSADIKKHWNVSDRTIAEWRSNKLIGYIKVRGKIWYPKSERDEFLKSHSINANIL